MIKPNPFTPQSGWEPRVFGGRVSAVNKFKDILREAKGGKANHVIVLGEWGIGKTSLLKQFKKIAQAEGFLASLCSISKFPKSARVKDGINLIIQEMLTGFPKLTISGEEFSKYLYSLKNSQLLPQTLFSNFLYELWFKLKSPLAIVMIDDIQNFSSISEIIDILRLVLSKEKIVENTGYIFILSSTNSNWAEFIDKHDPIGRFFRMRISLINLSQKESEGLITQTLKYSGVSFSKDIIDNIYNLTRGHPYELQLLASNLYEAQIEGKVTNKLWMNAFNATLIDLGKEYFNSLYNRASEREKEILEILALKDKNINISELRDIMILEKRAGNFPVANIKNFLYRLNDKGLINRLEDGSFKILDSMFAKYIVKRANPAGTE